MNFKSQILIKTILFSIIKIILLCITPKLGKSVKLINDQHGTFYFKECLPKQGGGEEIKCIAQSRYSQTNPSGDLYGTNTSLVPRETEFLTIINSAVWTPCYYHFYCLFLFTSVIYMNIQGGFL